MDTMDGELTMQDLLVVSESLEPYVLTYQPDHATDGAIEITALVVLKREEGVLLALPKGTLSEEVLERGRLGRAEDVFGPSALVTVPGVILDGGSMSATGTTFEVLLVDCLAEVVHSLREFRAFEEIIYGFEDGSSFSLPDPVEISSKALAWVEAVAPSLQRVGYYSAQEEPGLTTPRPGTPTLPEEGNVTPRRRKPGNPRTTSDAKPKKVTTADLAASMEGLLQAIPTLTSQVDQLHRRQVEFEASLSTMPLTGRPTLSKPLGGAPTSTSGLLGTMAKTIPAPPRTQGRQAPGLLASPLVKKPLELAELEKEKIAPKTEDSSLAQAVLAQSQALTTLVTQIAQASGDPMSDLAGSSATPGSRGALGRAKLQAELACSKGHLFQLGFGSDVSTDEPHFSSGVGAQGTFGKGHQWSSIPRTVWRVREATRHWLPSVSSHADLRLPDGREHPGRSRFGCPSSHHPRADEHGWWEDGPSLSGLPSRGPSILDLPDETPELNKSKPGLCSSGGPKAHHGCTGLPERIRCDPEQTFRVGGHRKRKDSLGRRSCSQGQSKGCPKKKAEMEGKGGGRGGDLTELFTDDAKPVDQPGDHPNPLTSSTTFLRRAISLPRLILRSRTAFSWCLRTSFTAKWQRRSLPTTCLPLPVPHPGCFSSGGSKLSQQRLRKVAHQRLLHVCVLVINYMYLGRFPTLAELGRSPNPWQLRCFQRLRALLHVCGSVPGDIPLVPGRSGFELGATLFQLEQFLAKTPELQIYMHHHRLSG